MQSGRERQTPETMTQQHKGIICSAKRTQQIFTGMKIRNRDRLGWSEMTGYFENQKYANLREGVNWVAAKLVVLRMQSENPATLKITAPIMWVA